MRTLIVAAALMAVTLMSGRAEAALGVVPVSPSITGTATVVASENGGSPFVDSLAIIAAGLSSPDIAVTATTQAAIIAAVNLETLEIDPSMVFFIGNETADPMAPSLLSGNLTDFMVAPDEIQLLFSTVPAESTVGDLFENGFLVRIFALGTSFGTDLLGTAAAGPFEVGFELSAVQPVPIPAAWVLFAGGAAAFGALRRKRQG